MNNVSINSKLRQGTGKGYARKLRSKGRIPAVLYGAGVQNLNLSIDAHDLELLLQNENALRGLLSLNIEDDPTTKKTVMIREIQRDPVKDNLIHIDFHEISMNKKITATVPVVTTGVCKGVEEGGTLQIIRRELEIECLPKDIPDHIEIDITQLEIGDSIHVEEIPLPGEIEIPHESNFTVLTIVSPRKEETAAVEEEAGEGEGGAEEAESAADDAE